jgi:Kef-type K+ transport system membrane component KefB
VLKDIVCERLVRTLPILGLTSLFLFLHPTAAFAAEAAGSENGHGSTGIIFLFLAILLISAKLGGIVEKLGQPAVIGEIGAGIILSLFAYLGFNFLSDIRHNETMTFIAELGAVILLFQIGLESNIRKMAKVGVNALAVALIGVIAPFVLGSFVLGPLLFPDSSLPAHLFIGASLVATSVGITAYVFQEMKVSKERFSQVVLGAAVIDDVLGLLVLAIITALASGEAVTPGFVAVLSAKAFGFLASAILLGNIMAKTLSRFFSRVHSGIGMKLALALTFALVYAYAATLVGLAPIVGAFAAGLVLDAVHFKLFQLPEVVHDLLSFRGFDQKEKEKIAQLADKHTHAHIENLIANLGLIFIPIFFVFTGLQIEFASLLNPNLYVTAGIITIVAIFGKIIAGFAAAGTLNEKLLVGASMVPRGEVGLIFASVGKSVGAINDELFSVIILVVIGTTFVAPPMVKMFLKRYKQELELAAQKH